MRFSCTRGVVCFRFWMCCGMTTLRGCRDYYVTRRPATERLAKEVAKAKGKSVASMVRDAIEASAREAGLLIARPSWLSPARKAPAPASNLRTQRGPAHSRPKDRDSWLRRPRSTRVIVVDTSALLAILNKEPERDRFLDVLANDDRVMVSAVTLYEAMLVAATRRGPDNLSDLAQMPETVQAEIVP